MELVKVIGIYSNLGKIELPDGQSIPSIGLKDENNSQIPFGSSVEITISYDENDFLSGNNGIVWGSYDPKQIEIINNALSAQNIITGVEIKILADRKIQLLIVKDKKDIQDSINFIYWHQDFNQLLTTNKMECVMKKLLFSFVFFSVLLLVGCQENSITDPISTETIRKDSPQNDDGSKGTINLDGVILDPSQGLNSLLVLGGTVTYEQHIVSPPLPPEYNISVHLLENAQLSDPVTQQTWNLSGNSYYTVAVNMNGEYVLEDHCIISDRTDGLTLVCRYIVTTNNVSLSNRWLELINGTSLPSKHTD
jgi:hypothetical protein